MFLEYSKNLPDGIYVFVAKIGLFDTSYEKLNDDFRRVLKW